MATRAPSAGGVHAHGCTSCRSRYEDVCLEPAVNARCGRCSGGQGWPLLIANRLPRDCCHLHTRPATKDELKTYRLSTGCQWFRCSVCARTFPYAHPRRETP